MELRGFSSIDDDAYSGVEGDNPLIADTEFGSVICHDGGIYVDYYYADDDQGCATLPCTRKVAEEVIANWIRLPSVEALRAMGFKIYNHPAI